MSDDALRAAEQLINDVWGGAIGVDDPEIEIIARHLAAYAEAEIVRRLPPPCHPAGPKMLAAIERWERMTKLEDAARAVVEKWNGMRAVPQRNASADVKIAIDALSAALGKEAEDAE